MLDLVRFCSDLSAKDMKTVQLMRDGVAFLDTGSTETNGFNGKAYYVIFSHEGELIDYLPVFDVEMIVRRVKEFGGQIGKCKGNDECHPGFTLAWSGAA
jgi:hypothetical protein